MSRCISRTVVAVTIIGSLVRCGDNATAEAPGLVALTVTGGEAAINPSFDPEVTRYSARIDPAQEISIIAESRSPEQTILIDGVIADSGEPLALPDAVPGRTTNITIVAPSGDTAASYEIVFLPADFPDLVVTQLEDQAASGPLFVTLRGQALFIAMLDNHGVPYFYRRTPGRPMDFKRHPSGEYSYAMRIPETNDFGKGQNVQVVLNEELDEIDRVRTVGLNHTDNHEFIIRENGNYVLMAYHGVIRDMTAAGLSSEELVEESVIQEISRDRSVIFEWTSWGHIPFEERLRDWADYAHVNSYVYDTDDNLLVSARGVSTVFKLDVSTGNIIWKLGGQSNDFTFVDDPYANLCGQHTASVLDNGNILIFDNGQLCWPANAERGDLTRVVEYELDDVAMTARLVWSYSRADAYTASQGSAQRLKNGNTLIGWGRGPEIMATEVDSAGNVVFELEATDSDGVVISYRVWRADE